MKKFIIILTIFMIQMAKAKQDDDANFVRYASIGINSMLTRGNTLYNGINLKYGKSIIDLQNFLELSFFITLKQKDLTIPKKHLGLYYSHFLNSNVEVNHGFYMKAGIERGIGNTLLAKEDIKPTRMKLGGGYEKPFNYYDFKKTVSIEFLTNPTIKFMEIGVFVKYKFDS